MDDGWLAQLYSSPALQIDRTLSGTGGVKQSVRILSDEGARAFAVAFGTDAAPVAELCVSGPDLMRGGDPECAMGVEGFRALGAVLGARPGLAELRLADHRITYEAAVALADGLRFSRSLVGVALWKCRMDDRTAYEAVVRLADIPTLKTINLGENVLTAPGKAQIEQWVAYSHNPALVVRMF
jgi:hypothetical protein